jgi:large subunit ribosomal protein L34e
MVSPRRRSRSLKRIKIRTPGGKSVVHYERSRKTIARCGRCGAQLNGVPRDVRDLRNLSKSSKRPNRAFGGVLCHKCLEEIYREIIRSTGHER